MGTRFHVERQLADCTELPTSVRVCTDVDIVGIH